MKISAKLLAGFILVAFIAGMVGFIGIRNIKQIDENKANWYVYRDMFTFDFRIAIEVERYK